MTKEQYFNNRNGLMTTAKAHIAAGDIEAANKVMEEVKALDAKYEQEATAMANMAALEGSPAVPQTLQNLSSGPIGNEPPAPADRFDSAEYKAAFMNYVCRGERLPEQYRKNQAQTTGTSDTGAVIPTTTLREIIRNLRERGVIFNSIRHMNIQGGVEIPILDLMPTATWVGEGASDEQKLEANTTVSFKYYGLECKIAQSILVSVTTFEEFQGLFVELATEAVITAIEKGIFQGTGVGQMLGVCKDPRVTNVVELTAAEFASFAAWKKKVFAKIPMKYQTGKFYMSLGTYEGHIDGMVDANGQPIARANYGLENGPRYRFGGKDVQPVESDVLPDFDIAGAGDVVAVFMDLKNYILNSNMTMTVVNWVDHDTNKKKTKVLLICDGKAADTNGILLVKKKSAG